MSEENLVILYFCILYLSFLQMSDLSPLVHACTSLLRVWRSSSAASCRDGWREGWSDGKFDRIEVEQSVDT